MPPNGTLLMDESENSDSALFFSLSLTIFAFVGVVIFIRRCVRCPPPGSSERVPENGQTDKPPSPIRTLYNSEPSENLHVPFSSCVFKDGGSTPNLPTNAEIASVISRDCMTSPELNSQTANTPDTPCDFGASETPRYFGGESNSNYFSFVQYNREISPSRPTLYLDDASYCNSKCTSFDGQSNYLYDYERGRRSEILDKESMKLHHIHLSLIASSPSLMQTSQSSVGLSPSKSNVSFSSDWTCDGAHDECN